MSELKKAPPASFPMQVVTYAILECTRRTRASADGAAETAPEDDVFDIVLSTEQVVDKGWCLETLSHQKNAVDMSYAKNGLSLLLEHGASTPEQLYANLIDPKLHVGIIDELEVSDSKLRGAMRFSRGALPQEIKGDVENRTRRFISVGYIKKKLKLTKPAAAPGEKDEYLVTRWMPVEGSIVSVPADPNARVGRSAGGQEYPVELESEPTAAEDTKMEVTQATPTSSGAAQPTEVSAPNNGVDTRALGAAAVADRNREISEIVDLCQKEGLSHRAAEFIRDNTPIAKVALAILEAKRTDVRGGVAAELRAGLPEKDRKQYSFARALDMLCRRSVHGHHFDGLEGEVHQHWEKRSRDAGVQTQGGIFVPDNLNGVSVERRTMATNIAAKGSDLVFDQPGEMIEFLRNKSVLFNMGARLITDLQGNIPFAKQNGDVTVQFVGENPAAPVGATDVATGTVTLQPKTMQGGAQFSRQLLRQSSVNVENMIRESFGAAHALCFDRGGLHGKGAQNELTGLYVAPDVGAVAMASILPTLAKLQDMVTAVARANALNGNNCGWVATPGLAGRLSVTPNISGAAGGYMWDGSMSDGKMRGYFAMQSAQALENLGAGLDEHALIFGNWADIIAGLWGGVEITVDNVTAAGSGIVKFWSFQMGDLIIRHGQSFAKATAAKVP